VVSGVASVGTNALNNVGDLAESAGDTSRDIGDASIKAGIAYGQVQAAPTIAEASAGAHSTLAEAGTISELPNNSNTIPSPGSGSTPASSIIGPDGSAIEFTPASSEEIQYRKDLSAWAKDLRENPGKTPTPPPLRPGATPTPPVAPSAPFDYFAPPIEDPKTPPSS
jgi:hypothetical protein